MVDSVQVVFCQGLVDIVLRQASRDLFVQHERRVAQSFCNILGFDDEI